jgi:hypothetical protein
VVAWRLLADPTPGNSVVDLKVGSLLTHRWPARSIADDSQGGWREMREGKRRCTTEFVGDGCRGGPRSRRQGSLGLKWRVSVRDGRRCTVPLLDPRRETAGLDQRLESLVGESCPYCGRDASEWTENDGQGVTGGGLTYCSQDCLVRDQARG